MRKRFLESVNIFITKRRYGSIFARAQAIEPSFTRVYDKTLAATVSDLTHKVFHHLITVITINAEPAFDGHRNLYGRLHRGHQRINQLRFCHQTGTETTRLDTIARAAAVDVDFIVSVGFANRCSLRHLDRIGTTELQHQRGIVSVGVQKVITITMNNRFGGQHLGVQQGMPSQLAGQKTKMPIGQLHHRCDDKSSVQIRNGGRCGHGVMAVFRLRVECSAT